MDMASSAIEITVLGSGTRVLRQERSMAGYAVRSGNFFVLMDCGDGVLRRGLEARLPMLEISAILFTHLHLDHCADLAPLLWSLHGEGWRRREQPLHLYGPPGLQRFFAGLRSLHGEWLNDMPLPITVREVFREDFQAGSWRVQTLPMQHGLPANGYRIQAGAKAVAYTGDTGPCAEAVALARDADLFICECSFANGEEMPTHLTAAQAGKLAAQAECKRLLLTHFYPECLAADPAAQAHDFFSGKIELAHDLMRLMI